MIPNKKEGEEFFKEFIMNEKTARLINKYASVTSKNRRELKREWNLLSHIERRKKRVEYQREVDKSEKSDS